MLVLKYQAVNTVVANEAVLKCQTVNIVVANEARLKLASSQYSCC